MALADEFAKDVVRPALLFDFAFDSGERNVWTGAADITVDGKTYVPLPGFDGSITVAENLAAGSQSTDIRIAGVTAEFLFTALNENFQDRVARIWIGALDANEDLVERELLSSGFIDDMPLSIGPDRQDLTIEIKSLLASRSSVPVLRNSSQDQALIDADDTFFDFVAGLNAQELRFGN